MSRTPLSGEVLRPLRLRHREENRREGRQDRDFVPNPKGGKRSDGHPSPRGPRVDRLESIQLQRRLKGPCLNRRHQGQDLSDLPFARDEVGSTRTTLTHRSPKAVVTLNRQPIVICGGMGVHGCRRTDVRDRTGTSTPLRPKTMVVCRIFMPPSQLN